VFLWSIKALLFLFSKGQSQCQLVNGFSCAKRARGRGGQGGRQSSGAGAKGSAEKG